MLSGQDFPIDDWSTCDEMFANVTDRDFERRVFQSYPSLQSRQAEHGHTVWKPYHGEPYDAQEWSSSPVGGTMSIARFAWQELWME